jgi:hypothetical protein
MPLRLNNILIEKSQMFLKGRFMKWMTVLGAVILFLGLADLSYARHIFPLRGTWNLADQKVSLEIGYEQQWPFYVEAVKRSVTSYDLNLTVVNWATDLLNLSTVLNGSLIVQPMGDEGGAVLDGRLTSKYTLMNQRPFEELELDFSIKDGHMVIRSFHLGKVFVSGRISLGRQPVMDLRVRFEDLLIEDYIPLIRKDIGMDAGGTVSGELQLQGPMGRVQIKGKVVSYNGFIGDHAYNIAQINFSGIYPVLYVDNSHITQDGGLSFEVQGSVDLTDLKGFKRQLGDFIGTPLVSQRGQTLEWTFKRLESNQRRGATELKYMIKKDESSDKDVNIFGVQRRMEF